MSGVFSSPKKPKIPTMTPMREDKQIIREEDEEIERRERKKIGKSGRKSTVLSGITAALKSRFGE